MKQTAQMNVPRVTAAVAGGALLMVMAAQLLAKPKLPPVARAVDRPPAAGAQPDPGSPRAAILDSDAAPKPDASLTAARPRPAVAAEPPIREMFVPLVGAPRRGPAGAGSSAGLRAPALPSATASTPGPQAAVTTPATAPADARSSVPTVSEIQMLGVIEADGTPQVLLKRSTTGESRYFAKGADAFGFTVDAIQESSVGLKRGGKVETVAMSSAVSIEGPSGITSAGSSGFVRNSEGGERRFGFGRDRGDGGERGERGDRRERGDRGERGERGGGRDRGESAAGGESSGFSQAEIFSLPTWTARLKKLDEVKAQIEPERYARLRAFMAERAKQETAK